MKDIKKRGLLMLVAIIVLAGIIIASSLAWYTKMVSIQSISFKLARWDYNANYQVDDLFVNVNEYTTIGYKNPNTGALIPNSQISPATVRYAAPGTAGTISIRLSAANSNTDVNYSIKLDKSTMSSEFQKRIYFYYPKATAGGNLDQYGNQVTNGGYDWALFQYGTVQNGPEGTIPFSTYEDMTLKWEWVYDYDEYLQKTDVRQYEVVRSLRSIYNSNVGQIIAEDIGNAFEIYEWRVVENLRWTALASGAGTADKTAYKTAYDNFMSRKYGSNFTPETDLATFIANSQASRTVTYNNLVPDEFSWKNLWSRISAVQIAAIRAIRTLPDEVRGTWLATEVAGTQIQRPAGMGDSSWSAIATYVTGNTGTPVNDLWNRFTSPYDYPGYRILMDVFDKMQTAERVLFFDDEDDDPHKEDAIFRTIDEIGGLGTEGFVADYVNNSGYQSIKEFFDAYLAAYEEFDEFDTKVGLSPSLYSQDMRATLHLSGVQAVPSN